MLYKIGDFSKKTDKPIRTLRYYDEIDLFKPKEVDLFTGYRYYSDEQIKDLELIDELKEIGFSLEEIKEHWNNMTDEIMLKKRESLLNEIKVINDKIKKVDYLRSNLTNGKIVLNQNKKESVMKKSLY